MPYLTFSSSPAFFWWRVYPATPALWSAWFPLPGRRRRHAAPPPCRSGSLLRSRSVPRPHRSAASTLSPRNPWAVAGRQMWSRNGGLARAGGRALWPSSLLTEHLWSGWGTVGLHGITFTLLVPSQSPIIKTDSVVDTQVELYNIWEVL